MSDTRRRLLKRRRIKALRFSPWIIRVLHICKLYGASHRLVAPQRFTAAVGRAFINHYMAQYHPSIDPLILITHSVQRYTVSYPWCHRAKAGLHPGQGPTLVSGPYRTIQIIKHTTYNNFWIVGGSWRSWRRLLEHANST